ncbi:MAG: hypothetical protein ACXWPM_10025, partial [Bdellovibrionota bacterium]
MREVRADSEIVVSDCLSELFRDAYRIHELASRFRRQARDLQEISMNAAIASGHAGNQSKVFGEIAKQIGIVSTALQETIEEVHGHTGSMSNRMLDCIVRSGQREKFVQGLALLGSDSGIRSMERVKADIDHEIWFLLDEVQRHLVLLRPQELRVRQLVDRVWSVVLNVRITAGETDSGGDS